MHYVKQFNINGVDTKQVACIELQGVPNAATEGCVGVLGMDMTSPTHEVYRCVAVNGSVYTWELLSAGMSIISATITGEGGENMTFSYSSLLIPDKYLIKSGDLILDSEGYLYQITAIGAESCDCKYCGTHIGGIASGDKDYSLVVNNGKLQLVTESGKVISNIDHLSADEDTIYRSSEGVASVRGIKTITDTSLRLFVGTKAEYDALADTLKENLFAIISDDPTKENLKSEILFDVNALRTDLSDGTFKVSTSLNAEKLGGNLPAYYRGHGTGYEYWQDFDASIPLNNLTKEGHWFIANKTLAGGAPYDGACGYLDVSRHSGKNFAFNGSKPTCKQTFTVWDTGVVFVRVFKGEEWSAWMGSSTDGQENVEWANNSGHATSADHATNADIAASVVNKGTLPTEASFIVPNTNGFGTAENIKNGFWRVWDIQDDPNVDELGSRIVPSIPNRQSIGTSDYPLKEAYINQVHGTADSAGTAAYATNANHATSADTATEAEIVRNGEVYIRPYSGTTGTPISLADNTVYVIKYGLMTCTLFVKYRSGDSSDPMLSSVMVDQGGGLHCFKYVQGDNIYYCNITPATFAGGSSNITIADMSTSGASAIPIAKMNAI